MENKYEETDKIIEEYIEMYAEKMDKIEELINDIRIKDTQYVNKLKAQVVYFSNLRTNRFYKNVKVGNSFRWKDQITIFSENPFSRIPQAFRWENLNFQLMNVLRNCQKSYNSLSKHPQ